MDIVSSPNAMNKKQLSANSNAEQKRLVAKFVREHTNLLSGKFTNWFTKESGKNLWQEASVALNAVPSGGFKDWKQWRKIWQDLKTRTKVKEAAVRKYRTGTGGGPRMPPPTLKPEEEVAVEALTKVSIEGHNIKNFEEQIRNPLPAQPHSSLQLVFSPVSVSEPPSPTKSPIPCPSLTPIADCGTNSI
ncbi:unnamed protein product [Ceutorhynchus assimilis]|uniref:Regulatory protein zeste n=1 Tax=Ceutorhynchus assimilis TaxID=467358 RepID=A0A9P0DUU9_9CUCU|nr:unnamed protein product [Ceutorhynchus assimilis]